MLTRSMIQLFSRPHYFRTKFAIQKSDLLNFSRSSLVRCFTTFQCLFKTLPRTVEIIYKDIDKSKYNELLSNHANPADIQEKIDKTLQEYEYIKYMSGHVPSDLSVAQMSDLIGMTNEKERARYIRYLFLTETRKIRDRIKKEIKTAEYKRYLEERPERTFGIFDDKGQLNYRLWGNTVMSRIDSRCISKLRTEPKLRHASLFGQKMIIDLDYDDHMSLSESRIQVRHIVMAMVNNLAYTEPYDIYFSHCDYQKPTMISLQKYFNTTPFAQMDLNAHMTTKSYLDVFDKDRLVYLSPDAPEAMKEYNHDDIYIIGGFLDKSCLNKPVSHLKAIRDGIRQYRLPLDEYVTWGSGSSKHLCIMHIINILNSLKEGTDWRTALYKNIPKRKLKDPEVVLKEDEQRRIAYLRRKLSIEKDAFNLNVINEKFV